MKKYIVTCTRIYNGSIEVEAESEEQALEIAKEYQSEQINWSFGEETVDYAEEAV